MNETQEAIDQLDRIRKEVLCLNDSLGRHIASPYMRQAEAALELAQTAMVMMRAAVLMEAKRN
ncbi:MAG: hypothetical protein ACYC5O_12085 [Anaerolineae bacterium]